MLGLVPLGAVLLGINVQQHVPNILHALLYAIMQKEIQVTLGDSEGLLNICSMHVRLAGQLPDGSRNGDVASVGIAGAQATQQEILVSEAV